MTQPPLSSAERLWRHFVGLFGGDAVERKYGKSIPPEWSAVLAKIEPRKLDRGVRRLLHSGLAQVPTLPAFVRLCEALGDDPRENAPDAPRLPPPQDPPEWDAWGRAANRHLVAHMMRRVVGHAGPYPPEALPVLLAAKNAWADDMREIEGTRREVPVDVQRECWSDYIVRADQEIAARFAEAA
jgi:hypothetical protein